MILLQLEYPREKEVAEQIFVIIKTRRNFSFRNFSAYIITIDFIEEFMAIYSHNEDFNFDFSPPNVTNVASRRTRGSDKGVRDEFRVIIKQQISRCNENIFSLIHSFISQEHMRLMHFIFDVDVNQF